MTARNVEAAAEGRHRRKLLMDFVDEFVAAERVAPTRAEIGEHLGVSPRAVQKHVTLCINEGLMEDLGGSRGLRTTPKS